MNNNEIMETFRERVSYGGDFPAALIDGFLMATQVDIEWRDDIFKGWDFYDASQSMEFTGRGYKIIVPEQKEDWCLHDFGRVDYAHYLENQELFPKAYLGKD